MDISEILKSYQCGNYKYCIQKIGANLPPNDKLIINKEFTKQANLNETAAVFLLDNNEAVCQAIIGSGKDEKKWLESLHQFTRLYSNYKSLLVIPVELEMNVVYNMLWWFWIKPQTLPYMSHHIKNILKSVSWCLTKVLRSCGEVVLGQQLRADNESSVVNLLKRASDQLLCLKPVACIQLLDIIMMTAQIFLTERLVDATVECMSMMKKVVDQIDLLRLHTEQNKSAGSEEIYFKFGLKCMNSTASLKNRSNSVGAFIITSSLICAVNEEYEHAISCLKGISEEEDSFNFMMNYLKAHCYLMSKHYSEAKLCLAYVMSGPVPPTQLAHYRLMLARLLSAQGDHKAALAQCDAVLASHSGHAGLTSLAADLAAQQARKLNVTTAELKYMRQLVQGLKSGLTQDGGHFESFEECCLLTLSRQFSTTLPEALYTLARQLYLTGYHVKSLDSYNELLELVKSQAPEATSLLPHRSQLVQECVLAHIKSNSLPEGEQLCHKLVSGHVPHTGGGRDSCSIWEVALHGRS